MNIFKGYVKNYHTLNLTVNHGNHSFTMSEIDYFSRLGTMLGYDAFTEDTCNATYRPMDLTWWGNYVEEYWHDFVLHLERENNFSKDLDTMDKLFDKREPRPLNLIGIMNTRNEQKVDELIRVAQNRCNYDNCLLIFRTNSPTNNKGYFDLVKAYLLKRHKIVATQDAEIKDISGTFFMELR